MTEWSDRRCRDSQIASRASRRHPSWGAASIAHPFRGMSPKEAARAKTLAKLQASAKERKAKDPQPLPAPIATPILRTERFLQVSTDTQFEAATHTSKAEFRIIAWTLLSALRSVTFRAGARLGFDTLDVIFMVFVFCAGNPSGLFFSALFGASRAVLSRVIGEAAPVLALVARRLWMPASPGSEAGGIFSHFPDCVAAVDTTPIRVRDGRRTFQAQGALLEEVLVRLLEAALRRSRKRDVHLVRPLGPRPPP
jgi:hypothetical protein